jgi:hypothetical protein
MEPYEQVDWQPPDPVFASVGDGCLFGALWKSLEDLLALCFPAN